MNVKPLELLDKSVPYYIILSNNQRQRVLANLTEVTIVQIFEFIIKIVYCNECAAESKEASKYCKEY